MSEIDRLLELHAQIRYSDRVTMDSSPKDIQERDELRLKCVQRLKLQKLVKERIDELSPCNSASDEYDEFMNLQSLVEESER